MCLFCARLHAPVMPRRVFLLAAASAAAPALAQVNVGRASRMRTLVPAETLEQAGEQEYAKVIATARQQGKLLPDSHPQTQRLHAIARRLIVHAQAWNPRAQNWRWAVHLIEGESVNAWCMPGGKIAFYTGLLNRLQLSDDETAAVMGHEMAHALREHARARLAKTLATELGLQALSSVMGLGDLGQIGAQLGTQLLSLKYSRSDETEADLVGLELAARAAYAPQASISLWQKMMSEGSRQAGPGFLSSHPSDADRMRKLEQNAPKVQALYAQARRQLESGAPGQPAPIFTPAPQTPQSPAPYSTPIGRPLGS